MTNLNDRAAQLFPDTYLQQRWIEAVNWLRSRGENGIWVADRNAPVPKWGLPQTEEKRAA